MLKSAQPFWALVAGPLLASGPVQAQQSPDWTRCLNQDGRFTVEIAFAACNSLISSATDTRLSLAIAYGRRGNAFHDKGEYDRAIADYTKAIEIDQKGLVAYNNRGIAYRAKGDNDSAIADYTRAIAIDPDFAGAYNNRGIAYRAKGDNDRAIAEHTSAIEIDPELASAYYNRALAYRAKDDNDNAIKDATVTIEINPRHAGAHFNRGLARAANSSYDRAIADYTKAIEFNPKHVSAYHNRGLAYRAKGDSERAITDHGKAAEIDSKSAEATAVPISLANVPAPPASIEKTALAPQDAPSSPFTLVLRTDLRAQQLTVVENDTVVHVWPISSGTRGYATPTGIFQPKSAHRMWYSRQYAWTPMPYAIFFVRGVAFHGTTITSRLGRSASHGCIRLATGNAAQLFALVRRHGFEKTQIIVFGAAKHDPPTVAHRAPTARAETGTSNGFPSWAKALLDQIP